jgi:hypothetical protein
MLIEKNKFVGEEDYHKSRNVKDKLSNLKFILLVSFILLTSISLISAATSSYVRNVPAYTIGGTTSSYSGGGQLYPTLDKSMCLSGQDFILQIDPTGCAPSVVRSDLLEEQNYNVFCPIVATQLNPLIKVEDIRSMVITSNSFPKGVISVGYYPAAAALGQASSGITPTSLLGNVGYAMIVLQRQPNESAMPDYVQGNLTARLTYSVDNAFGTGRSFYYLPELSDEDWNRDYSAYSFWEGRGYLRLEGSDSNGATIGVYSDRDITGNARTGEKTKIATLNFNNRNKVQTVYLPGFGFCMGGLNVELKDFENPSIVARIRVDSEIIELKKDDQFLENICKIKSVEKRGINEVAEISCRGTSDFILRINPKIRLSINNEDIREYSVGDLLYKDSTNSVYLGVIGNKGSSNKVENSYVRVISIPVNKGGDEPKLSEGDISYVSNYDAHVSPIEVRGGVGASARALQIIQTGVSYVREGIRRVVNGENTKLVKFDSEEQVFGKSIRIIGYAGTFNADLSQMSKQITDNYTKALQDYETIKENYASERYPSQDVKTLGEIALSNAIELANTLEQRKTALELCQEFSDNYGSVSPEICRDNYLLSNSDISQQSILVNGQTHLLSFEGVKAPSFEQYGLELNVRYANGEVKPFDLSENEIVYINDEIFYYYKPSLLKSAVYYKYDNRWQWSLDQINWMYTNTITTSDGKTPSTEQQDVIRHLESDYLNMENGRNYLLGLEAEERANDEYVRLGELTPTSATLETHLVKTKMVANNLISKKLNIGTEDTFDSGYSFSINKINLKKVAQVSLNPQLDYVRANSSFNFKIGIEKRNIKLSPEKAKEKIESLNSKIKSLEKITNNLGKVVSAGKAACLVTGGYLTFKNFLSNLATKGNARQILMRGKGGYYDQCNQEIKSNPTAYSSVEKCLLNKSDEIDASVNAYNLAIENQQQQQSQLESGITTTTTLGERGSNTDALATAMITKGYRDEITLNLNNIFSDTDNKIRIGNNDIAIADIISKINPDCTSLTQARTLQLNSRLLNLRDSTVPIVAKSQVEKVLGEIYSNCLNSRATLSNLEQQLQEDINNPSIDAYAGKEQTQGVYRGSTAKAGNKFGISIETPVPVQTIQFHNKIYTLELEAISTDTYRIKNIYNEAGAKIPATDDEFLSITRFFSSFKKLDAGSYQNPYQSPEIRYYETEPYKGIPAVVPFDLQKGWYAAVRSNLPMLGGLRAADDSGRVSSFYICNVGPNGREENMGGEDDNCQGFVPNIGATPTFSGLSDPRAVQQLMTNAVNAIGEASRAYNSGVRQVTLTINGKVQRIPVGTPAANIPDIQCEDFMSPSDCNLMFNICDPFICPSSRCDLGGAYPVKDVVQSGVIGGIALCLPNFPEVKIPVCVTGVNAGLEAYTSVLKSYQQCLNTSITTGQTVGICDEINSIYKCEFFWSQFAPALKYGTQTLIGKISEKTGGGGGEYLGVADAWATAQNSINYFTQSYADDSVRAFKARSTQNVGGEFCKVYTSLTIPSGNFFDNFIAPDSPVQFYGRFEEKSYTTATNPPISQYKVFYHIYAGKDYPANFQVYLRGAGSSFYQDTDFRRPVASGYIPAGQFKTDTPDFTAPSGYKELCIVVNGQEECGFKEVTTDFGVNYLTEQYVASQAGQTDITSEAGCVSGSSSTYSLLNPNIQAGAEEVLNPAIYNRGIIRVCATNNPGQGTDPNIGGKNSRWQLVGNCGSENLKCWLDTDSVKDVIKNSYTENQTLGEVESNYLSTLQSTEGQYLADFDSFKSELKTLESQNSYSEIISRINPNINKVFNNNERAFLYLVRGNAFSKLAQQVYGRFAAARQSTRTGTPTVVNPNGYEDGTYCLDNSECKSNNCDLDRGFCVPASTETVLSGGSLDEISIVADQQVIESPVFEFQDGTGSTNLYYKYANTNWQWSTDKNDWYTGTSDSSTSSPFPQFSNLNQNNKDFITSITGKTYSQGVQLLIHRTIQNDEGGILPCALGGCTALLTDPVTFSYDKIFDVHENGHDYFTYDDSQKKWKWSPDKETWIFAPRITTINGKSPFSGNLDLIRGLEGKNDIEGFILIFSYELGLDILPSGTGGTGTGAATSTCTTQEDCQKILGERVIQIATQLKQERNILDSGVFTETGAKSFECLALQLALTESSMLQCGQYTGGKFVNFQQDENPLYCQGNPSQTMSNEDGESSFGIMEINTQEGKGHCGETKGGISLSSNLATCRTQLSDLDTNIKFGLNLLIGGNVQESKAFTCVSGKSYSGWKRALRNYNGWGCNNPGYVETVLNNKDNVIALFPQCADDYVAPTTTVGSFIAGTQISTPLGLKLIENINIGDEVYSVNLFTNELFKKKIIDKYKIPAKNTLNVSFNDGTNLIVTQEHPFWNPTIQSYEKIKYFNVGDKVLSIKNSISKILAITSITPLTLYDGQPVYNLHVDGEFNNYLANGILVHNKYAATTDAETDSFEDSAIETADTMMNNEDEVYTDLTTREKIDVIEEEFGIGSVKRWDSLLYTRRITCPEYTDENYPDTTYPPISTSITATDANTIKSSVYFSVNRVNSNPHNITLLPSYAYTLAAGEGLFPGMLIKYCDRERYRSIDNYLVSDVRRTQDPFYSFYSSTHFGIDHPREDGPILESTGFLRGWNGYYEPSYSNLNNGFEFFAARLAWTKWKFITDAQNLNVDTTTLSEDQVNFWTYIYYNSGVGNGRNYLNNRVSNGVLNDNDFIHMPGRTVVHGRSARDNAVMFTATAKFIREQGIFSS